MCVLVATLLTGGGLSGLVLVQELRQNGVGTDLAVTGLGALAVCLVAGVGTLGSFLSGRRELSRRDQRIAAAAATSHDWVWESDAEDRITYSNDAVTSLLGYQPTELVGVHNTDLLFSEADRATAVRMREGADGSSVGRRSGWQDVEFDWRHRDGSRVTLQGSAVSIRDRNGKVVGFRGTRRLVTEDLHPRELVMAARQRIAHVLTSGDVGVALQPIRDLTTGQVAGVEALARFRDGRSPDLWFRDAHETGQTCELDELTFQQSLARLHLLPEPVYLSVNAGPALLMKPAFRESILTSGMPLHRLVIEITEHARVASYTDLNRALATLREGGVRFAIDDTGAGYASLSHVLELNPDIIKLDRALIHSLEHDRARRSLVTALVLLALDVGASVTGEGVETAGQLETLTTLGVDQAQGYFLARPTTDPDTWQSWWAHHRTSPTASPASPEGATRHGTTTTSPDPMRRTGGMN
jgi:PAS domain S-box-containing protein